MSSFLAGTGGLRLSPTQSPSFSPASPRSPLLSPTGVSFRPRAAAAATVAPVTTETPSFYKLLGVSEGGTFEDVKKAYRNLALKYHPDVSPPERTEEYTRLFLEVQEAYETLSDPYRRAIYDRNLARGIHFAVNARRRGDEDLADMSGWKVNWQDQLSGLKARSVNKEFDGENLSWAAKMRRKRAEASSE